VALVLNKDGPRVELFNKNSNKRIMMNVLNDKPIFAFTDENGKPIWFTPLND